MIDRQQVINQAITALETGRATPPNGQTPQSTAAMLRNALGNTGFSAYAAYKTAQRINTQTT